MKATRYISDENFLLKKETLSSASCEVGRLVDIDIADKPIGKVSGYGVALTASSCYELSTMDKDERTKFLNKIYSKDGLNLSVARLTVGSSDYSKDAYSYDDVMFDTELKHFSIERDMEYVIPMIKEILKINPDIKFYASPWSPPCWMKTGCSIFGGYMREKYIDIYADYIIKYIEAYKAEGIDVTALTVQNEPNTDQIGKSVACIWHPELEAKFIFAFSEKAKKKGLDVDVWLFDHCFCDWKRPLWMIDEYPDLLNHCSSIAFHYYSGCIEEIENIREKYPNVKYQFTEGGPRLLDNYDCDWCKWGIMMAKSLNFGFESFTGWNLMLDENGRPNIGPFYCGGLATLNSQTNEITYSGQYKALMHFSKFIKAGAEIYPCAVKNNGKDIFAFSNKQIPVEAAAIKNPDGSVVLHIVNANNNKRQVQVYFDNKWWYIDAMENTINTIVFEN